MNHPTRAAVIITNEPLTHYELDRYGSIRREHLLIFEGTLAELEQELDKEFAEANERLEEPAPVYADDVDLSAIQDRNEAQRKLDSARVELPKVREALRRIRNDLRGHERNTNIPHFGVCMEVGCRRLVEMERLTLWPYRAVCSTCAGCKCAGSKRHQN